MTTARWAAFLLLLAGCASSAAVTRNVRGRLVRGRFVTDDAYAAYLRGALLEAQGNREAALLAYTEGARNDPNSPELLTKIGALTCVDVGASSSSSSGTPGAAFDRAAAVDPAYEEAWTERAKCHLKRGQLVAAEHAARVAISLDPDQIEPALVLALALEQQKRVDEAGRWLQGLVVRNPASTEALEVMAAFARRTQDDARRVAAERALAELGAAQERRSPLGTARASVADVDAAIAHNEFDSARRLALSARLSSGSLALRAAAVGAASFAKAQAELVLAADPADGDARIAAAVSADLLRDDEGLAKAMAGAPIARAALSALATVLMGELLARRLGLEAKKAWIDAVGDPSGETTDTLVRDVAARQ